jgi:hypothetical protein
VVPSLQLPSIFYRPVTLRSPLALTALQILAFCDSQKSTIFSSGPSGGSKLAELNVTNSCKTWLPMGCGCRIINSYETIITELMADIITPDRQFQAINQALMQEVTKYEIKTFRQNQNQGYQVMNLMNLNRAGEGGA